MAGNNSVRWISINDRLPHQDSVVLVAAEGGRVTTAEWYLAHGWALDREDKAVGIFPNTITHWMPLPEPPPQD